jgi:hypothetical protein
MIAELERHFQMVSAQHQKEIQLLTEQLREQSPKSRGFARNSRRVSLNQK